MGKYTTKIWNNQKISLFLQQIIGRNDYRHRGTADIPQE
jgi:hypothetical protein